MSLNAFAGLGWISLASLMEAFSLFFIRQGGVFGPVKASLIYALGVVPLLTQALKYQGIGIVNFIWNILSTVVGFAVGMYFFGEKIHGMEQLGILVCLIGLALIQMAPKEGK
jgi:multidrug transporter EmrE-like cation transporter